MKTDQELLAEAEQVAGRIHARGGWVSADLRVWPEEAAHLLGVTVGTLNNWRSQLHPLPYVGGDGARVSYYLVDLLRFVGGRTQRAA